MTESPQDIVRQFRLLEYVGPRKWLEKTLERGLVKGIYAGPDFTIRECTLGQYPEIVAPAPPREDERVNELTARVQFLVDHLNKEFLLGLPDGGFTFPDGEFWPVTSDPTLHDKTHEYGLNELPLEALQ